MHSLQAELKELHAAGILDKDSTEHALAVDNGSIFSVFIELRVVLYVAVLLIISGVGIVLKNNLDRIGPVVIALAVGLVAAFCYVFAVRKRQQRQVRSVVGDYLLLLGALLVSADAAFVESQFHLLADRWSLYLLLLALVHAVTAYALDSRLVLSVALASLAGWFGVSQHIGNVFYLYESSWANGVRALLCAASVLSWRIANGRNGKRPQFNEVLEHYAINLGFWAGLIWCWTTGALMLGIVLVTALAILVIRRGLIKRSEWFIVYGIVYAAIGICIVTGKLISDPLLIATLILLAVISVAMLLWRFHNQLKEQEV